MFYNIMKTCSSCVDESLTGILALKMWVLLKKTYPTDSKTIVNFEKATKHNLT